MYWSDTCTSAICLPVIGHNCTFCSGHFLFYRDVWVVNAARQIAPIWFQLRQRQENFLIAPSWLQHWGLGNVCVCVCIFVRIKIMASVSSSQNKCQKARGMSSHRFLFSSTHFYSQVGVSSFLFPLVPFSFSLMVSVIPIALAFFRLTFSTFSGSSALDSFMGVISVHFSLIWL